VHPGLADDRRIVGGGDLEGAVRLVEPGRARGRRGRRDDGGRAPRPPSSDPPSLDGDDDGAPAGAEALEAPLRTAAGRPAQAIAGS
jgi:hypothetical protein